MNRVIFGEGDLLDIVGLIGQQPIAEGSTGSVGGDGLQQFRAGFIGVNAEDISGTEDAVRVLLD